MKRYITIVAVAIAALSCSKTYDVNPASQKAIGFGTWAENLTRARVPGSNTFTEGDNFMVAGFKVVNSANTAVFDTTTVTSGADPSQAWSYSPTRYWDPAATSYTFYAVSPAKIGANYTAELDPVTGLVAASTAIAFAGNNNDILVADAVTVNNDENHFGDEGYYGHVVTMKFNHIASLVDFKVKKHSNLDENTKLSITAFSISVVDSIGTFALTSTPDTVWTPTAQGTYTNENGLYPKALPDSVTTTAAYLIDSLIVMPQAFSAQKVNIQYTLKDEAGNVSTYNKQFDLSEFDKVDNTENVAEFFSGWEHGKHYVFIITIDANKIEFNAEIKDWTLEADNGHHYLLS